VEGSYFSAEYNEGLDPAPCLQLREEVAKNLGDDTLTIDKV
jgi:hypothetical protein